MESLAQRIARKDAKIAVVGLGYTGLASAGAFLRAGFFVDGIDTDPERVQLIVECGPELCPADADLRALVTEHLHNGRFTVRVEHHPEAKHDVVVVCVPTPVLVNDVGAHEPDHRALVAACESTRTMLRAENLVVIESTMAPGTTQRVVIPALWNEALVAHVPQRVTAGRLLQNATTMARVCGGSTPLAAELGASLYGAVTSGAVDTCDLVTAEITKTAENAYRDVALAFANQLSIVCDQHGANFGAVRAFVNKCPERAMLEAGAGVGGPCLTKDSWLLLAGDHAMTGGSGSVIAEARVLNDAMPAFLVAALVRAMESALAPGSRVVVLGMSHRPGSDEFREAPGARIAELLRGLGLHVEESDPSFDTMDDVVTRCHGAHAIVVAQANEAYREIPWARVHRPRNANVNAGASVVLDACRVVDSVAARDAGFAVRVIAGGSVGS